MMWPPFRSAIIFASYRQLLGLGHRPLFGLMLAGFAVPLRLGHFDGCRFLGVSVAHGVASTGLRGPVAQMPSLGRPGRPLNCFLPSTFAMFFASRRSLASANLRRWASRTLG